MKDYYAKKLKMLLPALMRKPVYDDSYKKNLEQMKELFIASVDAERFSELPIFKTKPLRRPVPESVYENLTICKLDVSDVGCGAICTLQAITPSSRYNSDDMKVICEIMESKGYYYPGRGLWWHWFDRMGCRRATHWYDICTALYAGSVVTVLVKFPDRSRGLFLNILGVKNKRDGDYIETADQLIFLTNEGELTLDELAKYISTAPYVW